MHVAIGRRISWGWVSLAVITTLVVSFLIFSGSGSCADVAATPETYGSCATEPIMGVTGAWVLGIVALVVVAYATVRAFRRPVT